MRMIIFQLFGKSNITISYLESEMVNQEIINLNATDGDASSNLTYAIDSISSGKVFSIDSETGVIKNILPLDYELWKSYEFPVIVSDSSNTKVSRILVTVNIIDENDNDPELSQTNYTYLLLMNSEIVGRILALDADSGSNGNLTYTASNEAFLVDERGFISVSNWDLLRYVSTLTLTVTVADNGTPKKRFASTNASVFITITGRQEPTAEKHLYKIDTPENTLAGKFNFSDQCKYLKWTWTC